MGRRDRALAPNAHVALALRVIGDLLDEVQPENVDHGAVSFTQEKDEVGIVLIPHRDLAGLSLVLWVDPNHADVSWAAVSDLHRHDEIDLRKSVFRIERSDPGWETALRSQIVGEFRRNITVTLRRDFLKRSALWCTIEVNGRPADFCVTRLAAAKGADSSNVVSLGNTSLQGPDSPTVSCPVPLAAWRRHAMAAWGAD